MDRQPAAFYGIEKCLGTHGVSLPSVVQIWRGDGGRGSQVWRLAKSKHLALGHIPSPPISFREQIRWDKGGFYSGLKVSAALLYPIGGGKMRYTLFFSANSRWSFSIHLAFTAQGWVRA